LNDALEAIDENAIGAIREWPSDSTMRFDVRFLADAMQDEAVI
jgi:hypothetical protein